MELRLLPMILRARHAGAGAICCGAIACGSNAAAPPPHGPAEEPPHKSPAAAAAPSELEVANREASAASAQMAADPGGPSSQPPALDAPVGMTNASLTAEPSASDDTPLDLPKGTTVLHIGDSFAGALGIELNREFKAAGVRGILKYETATYIPTWAWGKDLEKYLSKYHPDLVMITLGANELEIPDPAQRAPTIKHLVERLAGRPCVWVAPPLWQGARPALLDVIRESCAPCVYLDSSTVVPNLPRARDGIHPAMAARKAWARAVVEWLGQHRRSTDTSPWNLVSQ